jgi:hypothetical protein
LLAHFDQNPVCFGRAEIAREMQKDVKQPSLSEISLPSEDPGARALAPGPTGVAQVPGRINPTLQRIWVRSQMSAWTTLAIVGSSDRMGEGTMNVARGLARVAAESGGALGLIDGRSLELKHLAQVQARLRSTVARQTVVVLPLPKDNPVTVSVAQACDAAILCIFLGETGQVVASQTVEQIGRDRFLGSVILRA